MTYRFLSSAIVEMGEAAEYYGGKVAGLGVETQRYFGEIWRHEN